MTKFKIPIVPQAKQSVRGGKGGYYVDPKKKAYQEALTAYCKSFCQATKFGDNAVSVELHFQFPHLQRKNWGAPKNTRPDLDNLAKPVLDALSDAGIISDDGSICELFLTKSYAEIGCIYVSICVV